jgi:hypothetical protein
MRKLVKIQLIVIYIYIYIKYIGSDKVLLTTMAKNLVSDLSRTCAIRMTHYERVLPPGSNEVV